MYLLISTLSLKNIKLEEQKKKGIAHLVIADIKSVPCTPHTELKGSVCKHTMDKDAINFTTSIDLYSFLPKFIIDS